jgi:Mg2+ and Co2+ transporter CorA
MPRKKVILKASGYKKMDTPPKAAAKVHSEVVEDLAHKFKPAFAAHERRLAWLEDAHRRRSSADDVDALVKSRVDLATQDLEQKVAVLQAKVADSLAQKHGVTVAALSARIAELEKEPIRLRSLLDDTNRVVMELEKRFEYVAYPFTDSRAKLRPIENTASTDDKWKYAPTLR